MLRTRSTRRRSARLAAGCGATAMAALLVAACSSGSSGSSSSAAGSASSASTSSGGSSGATSNSTQAAQAAAAKAIVAKDSTAPAALSENVPLKSTPPAGKTIVQVACQVPQCQQIATGATQAAKALGWNVKNITYNDQDTTTFVNAMNQALTYHPVMVGITAVPQAVFQGEIAKYAAAGVLIDAEFTDATINPTVVSNPGGQVTNIANGTMLGEWVIADSNAQGQALAVGIPSLPTTQQAATSAVSVIEKNCSACKVTLFNASLAQVGNNTLVPAIVAALQKNPAIKYVISGQSGFTSTLPAALKAAGITGVKLVGAAPTVPDEQQLKTGDAFAFAPLAFEFEGWQLADVAARAVEKMPIPNGETEGINPTQLITAANVGSGTPTGTLEEPADYRAQFEKLWHIG